MKTRQYINQHRYKKLWVRKINQLNFKSIQRYAKSRHATFVYAKNLPCKRFKDSNCFIKHNGQTLVIASLLLGCVFVAPTFGVAVEDLKAPIKDLKDTLFGGWMWIPKIGAAVGGCVLAVYNQSIMPLATGAAIGLGIHFYDLYIKAEGALI